MIMGQDNGSRISRQSKLYHPTDRNIGRIHASLAYQLAGQNLALGIQAKQKHRFILPTVEMGNQVSAALLGGTQDLTGLIALT